MELSEKEAVAAYINKAESEEFYINAFDEYNIHGIDQFSWKWSWWAFFGGIFFLLYRKLYIEALVFFLLATVISVIPFGGLVLWIASGGVFPYFVYKRYKKIRAEIDSKVSEKSEKIELLKRLGGYNDWAIWIAVFVNVLVMIGLLYLAFFMMAYQP